MNHNFRTILDECLEKMKDGASIAECLEQYPQYANELEELLSIAVIVMDSPVPSPNKEMVLHSRKEMFAAVEVRIQDQAVSALVFSRYADQIAKKLIGFWQNITNKEKTNMKLIIRFSIAALTVAVLIMGGGATAASAGSLPGDSLYPLKKVVEDVQLFLTLDPQAKKDLEQSLQNRRIQEVEAVLQDGRVVEVEITGVLDSIGDKTLTIGDFNFDLTSDTQMAGQPAPGSVVEVQAVTQPDGSLTAQIVVVEDDDLSSQDDIDGTLTLEVEEDALDDVDDDDDLSGAPVVDEDDDGSVDENADDADNVADDDADDGDSDSDDDASSDPAGTSNSDDDNVDASDSSGSDADADNDADADDANSTSGSDDENDDDTTGVTPTPKPQEGENNGSNDNSSNGSEDSSEASQQDEEDSDDGGDSNDGEDDVAGDEDDNDDDD